MTCFSHSSWFSMCCWCQSAISQFSSSYARGKYSSASWYWVELESFVPLSFAYDWRHFLKHKSKHAQKKIKGGTERDKSYWIPHRWVFSYKSSLLYRHQFFHVFILYLQTFQSQTFQILWLSLAPLKLVVVEHEGCVKETSGQMSFQRHFPEQPTVNYQPDWWEVGTGNDSPKISFKHHEDLELTRRYTFHVRSTKSTIPGARVYTGI